MWSKNELDRFFSSFTSSFSRRSRSGTKRDKKKEDFIELKLRGAVELLLERREVTPSSARNIGVAIKLLLETLCLREGLSMKDLKVEFMQGFDDPRHSSSVPPPETKTE